jgi:UDP-4-amino-4,6-dideoxy-N-acetyl-beta-L-altrosamine N-acetyltransferase
MDNMGNDIRKIKFANILNVDAVIIEKVREWRNSEAVRKYMYNAHYIGEDEHMKWFESLKSENKVRKVWVIFYENVPVGVVNLTCIDYENKITDWGFYIGETAYRGLGIGSITLYRLMEYVFDKIDFHKMYTSVLENNLDALNLYKKFGFKEEGRLRKHILRDGKYIDVSLIGILNEEWKDIKNSLPIINRIKESYEIE